MKLIDDLGKLFSNDPAASCSRLLAVSCVIFDLIIGSIYFKTLTSPQVTYLGAILSGVLPYALGKFKGTV